jgi:hypothetical protein
VRRRAAAKALGGAAGRATPSGRPATRAGFAQLRGVADGTLRVRIDEVLPLARRRASP